MRALIGLTAALALAACGGGGDGSGDDGSAETGGGGLPEGTYTCAYLSGGMLYTLGELRIDGGRYGGFSGGMRGTYEVADDASITFSDGFEGTPDGFVLGGASWWPESGGGLVQVLIDSPSGNRLTVDCTREG